MKRSIQWLFAASLSTLLAACGGSGGGSTTATNPTPNVSQSTTVSGTAAAGAALSGVVEVKGANGKSVTAPIDANGHFSVDTTGLTAPMILQARGVAGGHAYVLSSVATQGDLGGTVNITPLTDLVVGNVVGDDSAAFFASPDFSRLVADAIKSAVTQLISRLGPLLTASGLPSDEDVLHAPFTADHSGMDSLLDLIEVKVDASANTATISYRLGGAVTPITDDFSNPADNTVLDVPSDTATSIDALGAIATRIRDFNALFANGIPTSAQVGAYFDAGFLMSGTDKAAIITYFTSADPTIKADADKSRKALEAFTLVSLDTAASPQTATIRFGANTMNLSNDGTGWMLLGNGANWDTHVNGESQLYQSTGTVYSELNLNVHDNGNKFQAGDYFIVTGPGLPAKGVVLVQYDFNSFANKASKDYMIYGYPVTDAVAKTIADGSAYTFTRYHDVNGDTNIYATSNPRVTVSDAATLAGTADDLMVDNATGTLIKRPLLSTETAYFPVVTAPTQTDLGNFVYGTLDVSWTLPDGATNDDVTFDRNLADGSYDRAVDVSVASDARSVTLNVPTANSAATKQSVLVFATDMFGRTVAGVQDVIPGGSGGTPTPTPSGNSSVLGAWRSVNGANFQYLILFTDGTFAYAENDTSVTEPQNGLEVGTYTYDATTGGVTLNVTYDDNTTTSGASSGAGSIGTPSHDTLQVNNGVMTVTLSNGSSFSLSAVDFSTANAYQGIWRLDGAQGAGSFEYLAIFPDGTLLYAENDPRYTAPDNGLEVGTYTLDTTTGSVAVNLSYDDNGDANNSSGIGSIGTTSQFTLGLSNSNNTLAVSSGGTVLLTFTRAF